MRSALGGPHLPGQLREEVLIGGEGPQAVQVADGGRQRLQLVAAAVQLLQQRQTGGRRKESGGGASGRGRAQETAEISEKGRKEQRQRFILRAAGLRCRQVSRARVVLLCSLLFSPYRHQMPGSQ